MLIHALGKALDSTATVILHLLVVRLLRSNWGLLRGARTAGEEAAEGVADR
jgi:hypothetical protein